MGTKVGVGISEHRNPTEAGTEAATRALQQAGSDRCDFVLLFATLAYDQKALLASVREATGRAPLCGAAGAGVIAQGTASEDKYGVVVTTICSDELRFNHASAKNLAKDSLSAGRDLGAALRRHVQPDALAFFLFPDGLTVNFNTLTKGLRDALELERFVPLLGGSAGVRPTDAWEITYQYFDDDVMSDGVACVLVSGKGRFVWSIGHGCEPIGQELRITKRDGDTILEIENKPALDALTEFLPPEAIANEHTGSNMIVGFKRPELKEDYDEYVVRSVTSKDPSNKSITIPTTAGEVFCVMRRDHGKIFNSNRNMAEQMKRRLEGETPKLVMQFDCAGRGNIIFRENEKLELLKTLQDAVGTNVPWTGFYTFGEIGSTRQQESYHTYTNILVALC